MFLGIGWRAGVVRVVFFFSSRRRHTRLRRDWSSDVCSSDLTKPFFLSGGIGLEQIESVLSFLQRPESKYCYAVDVNSKFEIKPGLKNIEQLEEFKTNLSL